MPLILIVDDEPSICWGLKEILTDEGYDVAVAATGEEAIASAEQSCPDVVLMDVCLPGIDGVNALGRIRSLSPTPPPIVIMTAFGSLYVAVRSLSAGAFGCLPKPLDSRHLASGPAPRQRAPD